MSSFDFLRSYPELKTVIVNLKSGTAFRGVVYRRRRGYYILRNSELLSDRGRSIDARSIDGELLVNASDVDFVQVL